MGTTTVTLTDVVLRDGLQAQHVVVPVPDRLLRADALVAGLPTIEAASFVNPVRVPHTVALTKDCLTRVRAPA
ncbi:MAG TPA: hypothetical protein DEQ61_17900 [Streptomyces sp.]|nr:hypothetical protein [Streptomyces sp.]